MSFDLRRIDAGDPQALNAFEISGPGVWPLASAESGVHVWCRFHENLLPVAVWVAARNEQTAEGQLAAIVATRDAWLAELAKGCTTEDSDPWPLGRIVRIYDEGGPTLDLRSGKTLSSWPSLQDRKSLILAGLPLPPEMEV
jgi:hypothetical protein